MITTRQINTERLELPIEEMIKERRDLKQVSFVGFSRTSSESQPFAVTPEVFSAYYPLFHTIIQRLARGEELGDEQFSRIKPLESILGISWKETSSIYPALDLGALEQLYIFRRRSELIEFLVDNSFLLPLLQEAYEQIRNYFGKSAQAVLEVVTDPEVAEEQELVLFVRITLSPEEAFERLKQLDEGWWLDASVNAQGRLCIHVEFE